MAMKMTAFFILKWYEERLFSESVVLQDLKLI